MAFSPSSELHLLDVALDNKYKHQLFFSSLSSQRSYFNTRIKHTFAEVTYQRKDNSIRIEANIDLLWNCNYVMYRNLNFSTKTFYAFITKMEYVNAKTTDIFIETDVYQTWLTECTILPSFVVREHVTNDAIGAHLVDEQLETGEYIMESYEPVNKLGKTYFIMGVSDNTPLGNEDLVGNMYGYTPTGLTYWLFENNATGLEWLKETIALYTSSGKADAISVIFTVPRLIVESVLDTPGWDFNKPIPSGTFYGVNVFEENKKLTSLNGYIPKNKKLHTYPYKFLYASNSDGLSATYRYEDFSNETKMNFSVFGSITPNPKIMLAPVNYKGDGMKYEYGLTLSGYPLGSWVTDTYQAWLASNGASSAIAIVGSGVALVGGAIMGNAMAVGGGAIGIAHQLAQIQRASIQPDQAKGQVGSGNLMFGTNSLDFYFGHMSIKNEFAKKIDDYLTMYGYKVNTLKVPNVSARPQWNYVQTIDINIKGAIPGDDMVRLKKIYDDGVTLWKNASNIANYSLNNTV